MKLRLHESGQQQVDGAWVAAFNIWAREPIGGEGPAALRAQISVGEEPPVDVAEGDEVEIAGSPWRVVQIVEDPAHHRGDVFIERAQD
jgi:hypothetical protein